MHGYAHGTHTRLCSMFEVVTCARVAHVRERLLGSLVGLPASFAAEQG